jgi:AraC-like DNA-binding protein
MSLRMSMPRQCAASDRPAADPGPRQYFGGSLRSFRSHAGLRLSEVDYDRARTWAAHTHLRAFFALLLRGGYVEALRSRPFEYRPLDLGFHPEATQHTDRIASDGTRFLLVELDPSWVGRLHECSPGAALEPRMCGGASASLAVRLYREYRSGAPASSLTIEGLVLEMLADLVPDRAVPRAHPGWLPTVLDLIRSERPSALSLRRIAREVRLHPVYLSRSFRERTGRSVTECLTGARIRFALRKLASPETPLAEIALDAGFADQSHFTKVFRRETGMTPGAFRDSLGPGPKRH